MPNKPTPPQPYKPMHERLFGNEAGKKRMKDIEENAAKAKTPVFPGASTLRTPSYSSTPRSSQPKRT